MDRCPVCDSPLYVLRGTATEIKLGCKNNSYPGNGGNPCPNYCGENPDPTLVTVIPLGGE